MTEANSNRVAFVFPGQGSQFVGMGQDLYESSPAARAVIDTADRVLGFPLSKLCFEGPADDLTNTYNQQPATFTISLACLAALREKLAAAGMTLVPDFVAGHSLGEYSALVAAEVLSLEDGIRLVRERGRLMRDADILFPGGMAAVLGLEDDEVRQVVAEASSKGVVQTANFNCPGQVVITGAEDALQEAMNIAKAHGAKRVVRLPISIAAHSPLMRSAQADLTKAIAATTMSDAKMPVVANVNAKGIAKVEDIRAELAEQLCSSVLWTQSVQYMVENGLGSCFEIGPGSALTGMVKRVGKNVKTQALGDTKSIDAFVAAYTAGS